MVARRRSGRALGDVVHELEIGHLSGIALPRAELDDPRVATSPVGEAGGDLGEEPVRYRLRAQEGNSLPLRRDVSPLPQRDHLLDDRPYLLGLRLGGLDPAVLDQRARQVGIERLPMGRVAPEFPACPLVPHGLLEPQSSRRLRP